MNAHPGCRVPASPSPCTLSSLSDPGVGPSSTFRLPRAVPREGLAVVHRENHPWRSHPTVFAEQGWGSQARMCVGVLGGERGLW